MPTLSNILLDKEILLESGTNELEVLVFNVAHYTFGINVAKVREVLPATAITRLPRAHPSIRGVFKLRNQVIPCVSLLDYLGIRSERENPESTLILTDLNQQQTAFLVDQVERIHRLSWQNILAVPGLDALSRTPVTALARCDGRLIVMLDFEMILDEVTQQYFRTDAVENPLGLPRETFQLLLAEDSPTVREAIATTLRASGYGRLMFFENGAAAWNWIEERFRIAGRIEDVGDLVIADVEMPQIDGLHLTKRIKEHPELKKIPVLLYSSIITPDNRKKGNAVGADAQVSKPELTKVVQLVDELIAASKKLQGSGGQGLAGRSSSAAPERSASGGASSSAGETSSDSASHSANPAGGKGAPVGEANPSRPASQTPSDPPSNDVHVSGSSGGSAASQLAGDAMSAAALAALESELASPTEPGGASSVGGSTRAAGNRDSAASPGDSTCSTSQTEPSSLASNPTPINSKLWGTFLRELLDRLGPLQECFREIQAGSRHEELLHELARTLHTIKSASMVVPVDAVTRCTHLVESLLEAARQSSRPWPQEAFRRYVEWLDALATQTDDPQAILAQGHALETELHQWLSELHPSATS